MTAVRAADVRAPMEIASESSPPRLLYVLAPGHPRAGLVDRLSRLGYASTMAADVAEALRLLVDLPFAVCLLDLASDRSALTAIRLIRARHAALPIVGIIGPSAPAVAAEALRNGVVDLLSWPFDDHDIAAVLANIRDRTPALLRDDAADTLVVHSPAMREVMARVREAAATRQAVCLCGAPGTGKTLVARALHEASPNPDGPFVSVDCADRAPSEIERQLFGEAGEIETGIRGTGIETISTDCAFARASGGTLFVRHLDEAPTRVQLRLAAILRDREVFLPERRHAVDLDVRLVAACRGTAAAVGEDGQVRRELAARFAVRLDLPSLRRRREDIAPLAMRFLARSCAAAGREPRSLSRAALELLTVLPWPGHTPALEQVMETLAGEGQRPVIHIEDVLKHVSIDGAPHVAEGLTLRDAREQFERDCISTVLARHQGRVGDAARALGIQRTNLYRKVRQLGIPKTLLSSHR